MVVVHIVPTALGAALICSLDSPLLRLLALQRVTNAATPASITSPTAAILVLVLVAAAAAAAPVLVAAAAAILVLVSSPPPPCACSKVKMGLWGITA